MRIANKVLIGAAIVAVFGLGAMVASNATNSVDTTSPVVDISGPCDEAENVNDPRCAGARPLEGGAQRVEQGVDISGPCDEAEHANDLRCTGGTVRFEDDARVGDDISGPCDEAEHVNDPRCTGAADDRDHDNSGPGSGGDDDDDDDHDNSGPGSGGDDGDHDNSGPGSGDDH